MCCLYFFVIVVCCVFVWCVRLRCCGLLVVYVFYSIAQTGEQLRRAQEHADAIEELQDRGDKHMRAISSVQGAVMNKFKRTKKRKDGVKKGDKLSAKAKKQRDKERKEGESSSEEEIEGRAARKVRHKDGVKGGSPKGKVSDMYQADFSMLSDESQSKIKQTDQALDQIGKVLFVSLTNVWAGFLNQKKTFPSTLRQSD